MKKIIWHAESINTCLQALKTSKMGLSSEQARQRLIRYGKNHLESLHHKTSILKKWFNQFNNILIYILIIAAIITGSLAH